MDFAKQARTYSLEGDGREGLVLDPHHHVIARIGE